MAGEFGKGLVFGRDLIGAEIEITSSQCLGTLREM